MAQKTSGILSVFTQPKHYDFFQDLLGAAGFRRLYTKIHLQPFPMAKILDIGCGTSEILTYLPDSVKYVGYDLSQEYIEAARERYGDRGKWHCAPVSEMNIEDQGTFDIAMANGVFHHLDDDDALRLSEIVAKALKPTGRFCSFDGCYIEGQNQLARFLISKDRGLNVRDQEGYLSLVCPYFGSVELSIRNDMLRVPYTHAIIVAEKPIIG